MAEKVKDPQRQLQGRLAKARGKRFEELLDITFEYYKRTGFAIIDKTPEPMKILRSLGEGRFIACFEKKAQPDYEGTIKGGRSIMFEAKYTTKDRIEQSRVLEQQAEYLEGKSRLGARCFVIVGFSSGAIYNIPWAVWANMKDHYGRKYVKESDIQNYKVQTSWNGTLLLLA